MEHKQTPMIDRTIRILNTLMTKVYGDFLDRKALYQYCKRTKEKLEKEKLESCSSSSKEEDKINSEDL